MYTWEEPFAKLVAEIRRLVLKEVNYRISNMLHPSRTSSKTFPVPWPNEYNRYNIFLINKNIYASRLPIKLINKCNNLAINGVLL